MPLLLAFTDAGKVGMVLTASGFGAMFGAAASTALSPRIDRPVAAIVVLQTVQGLLMIVTSLRASVLFVGCAAFALMLLVPLMRACRLAVWQLLAPASMQGRVLLLLQTLMQAMLPLSAAALGPLADAVFEPCMASDGIWADSLGLMFGTGRGRGAAVMMALLGVSLILVAVWAATRTTLTALRIDAKKTE
jgi:MFS transporter, DHA3 family, macrolide efflux protein